MNRTRRRRYIFIDYDTLALVKVKKLQKVATKLFVFVDTNQHDKIPLNFVRKVQAFGKDLKWILVSNENDDVGLNFHMAFVMGRLHQKVGLDVEFLIVSDEPDFDTLVGFINASRRKCRRVTRYPDETYFGKENAETDMAEHLDDSSSALNNLLYFNNDTSELSDVLVDDEIIEKTAAETIRRMILEEKRPRDIAGLKEFILLNNQEVGIHQTVDRIIQKMKDSHEIEISKGQVLYNF